MSILDRIFRPKEIKQPSFPLVYNYNAALPPERNLQGYLQAYGEIGWLFAVASKIATGVSDAKWRLYKGTDRDKRSQIPNHSILKLLDYVNPFQTCAEFIELHDLYISLAGECFWVINKNKLGEPQEVWIAPPDKMSVIPSKDKFIAGYIYTLSGQKTPLGVDEVIHHKLPNPYNPYRGLGVVQALAIDLDSELYSNRWNRNFFFNNALPGAVMFPEGNFSEEQFKKFKEQWDEQYKGVAKAFKMAVAPGIKDIKVFSQTIKDMDFRSMRLLNRDNILGAFGMPLSVMGISENVNRANAEAGDYTFARWIIKPRLNRLKNKLNEQLLPMFRNAGELELDFDEVVPQTLEQKQNLAESGMRAGYMTINEARQLQGLDPLDEVTGNVLLVPLNLIPTPTKSFRVKKSFSDEWKETFWKGHAVRAEVYERKMIISLRDMFIAQKTEALKNLKQSEKVLISQDKARESYIKLATPILTDLLKLSIQNGNDLINPKPPHRAIKADPDEDYPISEEALKWLKTRIGWAAEQIGEETASLLSKALTEGFEAGEDIPTIARRVRTIFDGCDKNRSIKIARTETIMASNEGALRGYGESGVVDKVEFFASSDERCCEDCDAMNGEEFAIDDGSGIIPLHPDCRCCWLPVV